MTPLTLTSLADLQDLTVDTIIDVRSPAEYAEDHVPGAINLPVLSDTQRAEVGTIYTRVSPFKARKIGGALVAKNTATHLQGPLADKDGAWQPLVYCWRGGQRSGAFATILDQVGWRVQLLKGGYQSYRREVVKTLYDTPLPHRLMLVDGGTGTAKTALLHQLAAQGAQILDLEGIAAHRGSLFGTISTPQPAQKMFETRLATALTRLNPDKITFVEAESSRIGERIIPPSLWASMNGAPRLHLSAPLKARSRFLCRAYADLTQDKAALSDLLDKLRPYHARDRIAEWHMQAEADDWQTLAAGLIADHYDPRYAKSGTNKGAPVHEVALDDLDDSTLARTAEALFARFS
ncbi:tRNA 2-selenouridine(34) synthase MnmH [Aquicoccus sp. G2-2]|uniref:tRNA 2-selenouridine(34) synthase MnmH n=1 Tax=Aquicoccus sp. G2-2 TaxID=3092120 RepID=UPI002AE03278|nr:tRNA 2-selenouridine(34) synthase MnmH [Aquicoccus sp. G2-2]MEA1112231.1 tRNA 2-selenouridine(34) synthase MnmH [Aquicoccus sp. G2-2]